MAEFPIDACFFDFDGTLGDTYNGIRSSWQQVLSERGLSCPDFDKRFRVGPPAEKMAGILFPEMSAGELMDLATAYKQCYDSSELLEEKPYPWSRDILELCRASGKKIYVVTYKRFKSTLKLIERYGFSEYFSGVFCTDVIPGQTMPKKDLLKLAVQVSGVPAARGVMIGDTELDILAGHEAGVHTVAVSWGYAGMDILKKASPEFIASNYDEFISIFKSFC